MPPRRVHTSNVNETPDSALVSDISLRPRRRSPSWLPEILFAALVLTLVAIWILQNASLFARRPGSDWNSSEWMIDYAAGFVRRGLGGAVLRAFIRWTPWGFFSIWMTLTTSAYLALCGLMIAASRRLGGPAIWRFALLLNPMLLVSAAEYGSFARKDILFLWATLLNLAVARTCLTRHQYRPEKRLIHVGGMLASTILVSLVLALLHEGIFLFAWLPLNLAVAVHALNRLGLRRSTIALLLTSAFIPALLAVAAGTLDHGDSRTAQSICTSWPFATCSAGSAYPPAIRALGWSLSRDIRGCLAFAPEFPLYLAVFGLFGALQIGAIRNLFPTARVEHLVAVLLFALAGALPLFLLGADWGRWLFLIAAGSLFLMLSDLLRPAVFCLLPPFLQNFCRRFALSAARTAAMARRPIEAHPVLFGIILVMLPVAPLPIPAATMLANPVAILINFLGHVSHR